MKKYYLSLLFIIFCLTVFSCKKSSVSLNQDYLFGTWVEVGWDENIQKLQKKPELDDASYGFIIYANGKFVEHANAGFCGTPPIVYARYEGNWSWCSDDSIQVDVDFWGGTKEFAIKIISVDEQNLWIKHVY